MATFGNDVDWTTGHVGISPENVIWGSPFDAPESGTLNHIDALIAHQNTSLRYMKAAVYVENGSDWDLVAESDEVTISQSGKSMTTEWIEFPLDGESITSGETYALVVHMKAGFGLDPTWRYDSSEPLPADRQFTGIFYDAVAYTSGFPDPSDGVILNDTQNAGAIYADYTPTATGTNTQINIGDVWKEIEGMQINIGDTWKAVEGAQINIGDDWKTIF